MFTDIDLSAYASALWRLRPADRIGCSGQNLMLFYLVGPPSEWCLPRVVSLLFAVELVRGCSSLCAGTAAPRPFVLQPGQVGLGQA